MFFPAFRWGTSGSQSSFQANSPTSIFACVRHLIVFSSFFILSINGSLFSQVFGRSETAKNAKINRRLIEFHGFWGSRMITCWSYFCKKVRKWWDVSLIKKKTSGFYNPNEPRIIGVRSPRPPRDFQGLTREPQGPPGVPQRPAREPQGTSRCPTETWKLSLSLQLQPQKSQYYASLGQQAHNRTQKHFPGTSTRLKICPRTIQVNC